MKLAVNNRNFQIPSSNATAGQIKLDIKKMDTCVPFIMMRSSRKHELYFQIFISNML